MLKREKEDYFVQVIRVQMHSFMRIAYSYTHHNEDAKDLVSAAILKAYAGLDSLQDLRSMKTWITQILINECRNDWKKRQRTTYVPFEEAYMNDTAIQQPAEDLVSYICELEPPYREVIVLYYYDGYRIREIAEILGISAGTVKSRLSRGRAYLRDFLKQKGDLVK